MLGRVVVHFRSLVFISRLHVVVHLCSLVFVSRLHVCGDGVEFWVHGVVKPVLLVDLIGAEPHCCSGSSSDCGVTTIVMLGLGLFGNLGDKWCCIRLAVIIERRNSGFGVSGSWHILYCCFLVWL
jgi:hypothetical protein